MQLQILKSMVLHEVRQIRGFFKHSNDSESATDMTSWPSKKFTQNFNKFTQKKIYQK